MKMDPRIMVEVNDVWEEELDYEYNIIENVRQNIGDPCRFVEIGCGALGFLKRKQARLLDLYDGSVGIDMDRESLLKNAQVNHRVCGTCYSLPLKAGSVDMIVYRWVFEHLEWPENAMREVSRVLREGGYLYIVTSNLLNYGMLISKITPTSFHNIIRSEENIRTFYRANTERKLAGLALRSGFEIRHMEFHPLSFMYYAFNKELFLTMKQLSGFVSRITNKFHLKITCLMQKVHDPWRLPESLQTNRLRCCLLFPSAYPPEPVRSAWGVRLHQIQLA